MRIKAQPAKLEVIAAKQVAVSFSKGLIKKQIPLDTISNVPSIVFEKVIEVLLEYPLLSKSVLLVYELAAKNYNEALLQKCMKFVRESFVGLRAFSGDQKLSAVIGEDLFRALVEEHNELERERARFRKGIVHHATWPQDVVPNPDGTLPYELLSLKLSEWPFFIDPTRRERYLSNNEFQRVLRKTPEQFYMLPRWRQQILKAEVGLF